MLFAFLRALGFVNLSVDRELRRNGETRAAFSRRDPRATCVLPRRRSPRRTAAARGEPAASLRVEGPRGPLAPRRRAGDPRLSGRGLARATTRRSSGCSTRARSRGRRIRRSSGASTTTRAPSSRSSRRTWARRTRSSEEAGTTTLSSRSADRRFRPSASRSARTGSWRRGSRLPRAAARLRLRAPPGARRVRRRAVGGRPGARRGAGGVGGGGPERAGVQEGDVAGESDLRGGRRAGYDPRPDVRAHDARRRRARGGHHRWKNLATGEQESFRGRELARRLAPGGSRERTRGSRPGELRAADAGRRGSSAGLGRAAARPRRADLPDGPGPQRRRPGAVRPFAVPGRGGGRGRGRRARRTSSRSKARSCCGPRRSGTATEPTGDVEVVAARLAFLSRSETPPVSRRGPHERDRGAAPAVPLPRPAPPGDAEEPASCATRSPSGSARRSTTAASSRSRRRC